MTLAAQRQALVRRDADASPSELDPAGEGEAAGLDQTDRGKNSVSVRLSRGKYTLSLKEPHSFWFPPIIIPSHKLHFLIAATVMAKSELIFRFQ